MLPLVAAADVLAVLRVALVLALACDSVRVHLFMATFFKF